MYHKYSQSIEEIKNDETKKEYVDELVEMKKNNIINESAYATIIKSALIIINSKM